MRMVGNVATERPRNGPSGRRLSDPQAVLGTVCWEDWVISVEWEVRAGVPTPTQLHIIGKAVANPPPSISSDLLRRMPLAQVLRESRAQIADGMRGYGESLAAGLYEHAPAFKAYISARAEALAEPFAAKRTAGRDLGDEHYRQVAAVYKQAVVAGDNPTQAVALWLAGDAPETASKSTASKQVARARARAFLPPTTRGRVGPIVEDQS